MCYPNDYDFRAVVTEGFLIFACFVFIFAGYKAVVSVNDSWDTSTKVQFSLIEQHYAVLAKTNISDHHRQVLQQQLKSLLRDPICSCKQFAFARVLLAVDPEKSESA